MAAASRLSLRGIFYVLAGWTMVMSVALILTTSFLRQSSADIVRVAESRRLSNELRYEVLSYNRLSNLDQVRGGEDLARLRARSENRMLELLGRLDEHVGSPVEQRRVDAVKARVVEHVRARERLDASGRPLEEIIVAISPAVQRATEEIEDLNSLNHAQVRHAIGRANVWNDIGNLIGILALVLLLAAIVLAVLTREYVSQPLKRVAEALAGFRPGAEEPRVPEKAPEEISRIGRAFNQMADAFEDQRHAQLEFLGGVAHDLRDPLATIKLGLDRITTLKAGPQEIRAYLPLFRRQVERMDLMISDLAEVTTAEYGQLRLSLAELSLSNLVEVAVARHHAASPVHEIELRTTREALTIIGDGERLDRVLDNLLSNAIKYSPRGGTIDVVVERATDRAVVSVRDPGIGIAPEDQEVIFLPFRRLPSRDRYPGLGIGLSVIRKIVEAHTGHIELESAPGRGSTFRLSFPLAKREEGAAAPRQPAT